MRASNELDRTVIIGRAGMRRDRAGDPRAQDITRSSHHRQRRLAGGDHLKLRRVVDDGMLLERGRDE